MPLAVASKANECSVDAKGIHRQLAVQWRRRGEPHGDPPNPAGVVDAQQAEQAVRADRHRAQPVGEHEIETGRARHLDVEMVRRPVAGHLGVATRHVRVDVLADGAEWVGPRLVGEPVIGRHHAEIGHAVQAEQHHRPPLLDGDRAVRVDLLELHHDLGARPRRPHRRDPRPGVERFTGNQRPVQHDVVLAVHPAADALP